VDPDVIIVENWAVVRRQLDLDRAPAVLRLLDLVALHQAETHLPVPLSDSWLRRAGLTHGEAAAARKAAARLERAGVLARWRGAGRTPDLWRVRGPLARWRIPWRTSAAAVENLLAELTCRAKFAVSAQIPAQGHTLAAHEALSDHECYTSVSADLGFRGRVGAASAELGAATANGTPVDLDFRKIKARLNARNRAPLPLSSKDVTSSSGRDDDGELRSEGARRLAQAITEASGALVWGEPAARLERVAQMAGDHLEDLAEELRRQTWARSPVALVRHAEALLPVLRHGRAAQAVEAGRRRLELLERLDPEDLSDEMRAELTELRERYRPGLG